MSHLCQSFSALYNAGPLAGASTGAGLISFHGRGVLHYRRTMARVTQITPFVMTHDLGGSLAFFCDVLGFTCGYRADNYAFLHQRPGGALRVVEVDAGCDIGEQMIYFDCDDVDAVFAGLKDSLATLPKGRVRAPFDQPYGMREFHVKDPDSCLIFYGMDIPPSG